MRQTVLTLLCVIGASITGRAHFVFVVPDGGNATAKVLLSETLQADAQVDVGLIAGTTLTLRDSSGRETPLRLVTSEHAFSVSPGAGQRGVVHGLADLGVNTNGGTKPHLLLYYPKTIVGHAFDPKTRLGDVGQVAGRVATLPEATSSFGAAVSDGWLYVYGGHVVPTHSYSTEAVSGKFNRLRLADGKTWERLPDGPPVQGMNLAAHGGKIYRVGGMQPRNQPGQPQDIYSIDDVSRFDPATGKWEAVPPLPVPRSSHDVVVVGSTMFVVGGWTLKGKERTEWPDSMEMLDLSATTLAWTRVPQPFKRRALIAAVVGGTIHVIGGFDEKSQVVHGSAVYDTARREWSTGPDLPGGPMNGFGPAATVLDGSLYVSVDDGGLYRWSDASRAWTKVGAATPRIVHRLVADGRRILVIGGAFSGKNSDLIEAIRVD